MTGRSGTAALLERLAGSEEPPIRIRARRLAGRNARADDPEAIRGSRRVATLLAAREPDGRLQPVKDVYKKWYGAHWVLVDLADLAYPAGDESLYPMRDQVYETWLSRFYHSVADHSLAPRPRPGSGVPVIEGRARRCASQQGNALFATLSLGIADNRAHSLAELLLRWQWPDGGWNCDKKPAAAVSSFHETITPLRGLTAYLRWPGAEAGLTERVREAVKRAAELLLCRRLFRRRRDGAVMSPAFLKLAYPRYWHYDLLFGLVVMKEAGLLGDPRCGDALDALDVLFAAGRRRGRSMENR